MSKKTIIPSKNASIVLFEIIVGITLSIVSLIVFALITHDVLQQQTTQFDSTISQAVYAIRSASLTQWMIIISLLGADFMVFIAGIVTILLAWKKHKHEAILFLTVLGIGLFINVLLKMIFQRPRPEFDPYTRSKFLV
jgi:undecaprenyl-diphosphatase